MRRCGACSLVVGEHLVPQVTDSYNAGVLVLLAFIGGFVALVERSGGASAFARAFAHRISSGRRVQLGAWAGGIGIFLLDLGTPLIVGPVFRPLVDRLRISRQKLAFILDSTASPVAILVPFIGWGVYVMGLLRKAFDAQGAQVSEYDAFVAAIPFQFYAWLAIATVPIVALSQRDWGPMAVVEAGRARGEVSGLRAPRPRQPPTSRPRAHRSCGCHCSPWPSPCSLCSAPVAFRSRPFLARSFVQALPAPILLRRSFLSRSRRCSAFADRSPISRSTLRAWPA